jgi:uncharacterized protein YigE (DUF2233 family)
LRDPIHADAGLAFTHLQAVQAGQIEELHLLLFPLRAFTLTVIDNPDGTLGLPEAARLRGALAVVNGGYFQPDRSPLGLMISAGNLLHPLEKAKLLSGVIVAGPDGVSLKRFAEYKPSPATYDALQAGPFLVDRGRAVIGLDNSRSAARTVIFTDTAGNGGLLLCRNATLAEMAQILTVPDFLAGAHITRALNLDGGTSSALWVRSTGGESFSSPGLKTVRNYLALVPR